MNEVVVVEKSCCEELVLVVVENLLFWENGFLNNS